MNRSNLDSDALGMLTKAGWAWAMFVAGLIALGAVVMLVVDGTAIAGGAMFAIAALWSVLVVPVMLVVKSHVIRAGWESRPADPETYFRGLVVVWATITIGGVLALLGCLFDDAMLPGGLLAGVMLTILVVLRPSTGALGTGMSSA